MRNILIQVWYKDKYEYLDTSYLNFGDVQFTNTKFYSTFEEAKIIISAYKIFFPDEKFRLVKEKYLEVDFIGENNND